MIVVTSTPSKKHWLHLLLAVVVGEFAWGCVAITSGRPRATREAPAGALSRARTILALALQFRYSGFEGPTDAALARELYQLELDQSQEADWVTCMLLPYYLGTANDEDLYCDVGRRGRRVVPLLNALLAEGPYDFGGTYLRDLGKGDDCWRRSLEDLVGKIEAGEVFECF